ncbi:hypothetical protein W97_08981 [Coniosporium apollinis CBS 100218]|uniref:Uncharacterized protein n=1 Tax=Coniosporium apollinis (strain CBS 100218) TaxID=1168221 RepID=R7Z726_CONA1|nr:uncharacterized protein W97_08981 [Coniosporium apollinis CBS 100218]EON69721.1 hypothetical protein W97_08981 [Coniosporium apollinis CBS 100218]
MDHFFLKKFFLAVCYFGFVNLIFGSPDERAEISRLWSRRSSSSTVVLVPRRLEKHKCPHSDTPLVKATVQETKAAEVLHRVNAAKDGLYELLSDLAPAIAASGGLRIDGGTWKDWEKFDRVSFQCTKLISGAGLVTAGSLSRYAEKGKTSRLSAAQVNFLVDWLKDRMEALEELARTTAHNVKKCERQMKAVFGAQTPRTRSLVK